MKHLLEGTGVTSGRGNLKGQCPGQKGTQEVSLRTGASFS